MVFLVVYAVDDVPCTLSMHESNIQDDHYLAPIYNQLIKMEEGSYIRTKLSDKWFVIVRIN